MASGREGGKCAECVWPASCVCACRCYLLPSLDSARNYVRDGRRTRNSENKSTFRAAGRLSCYIGSRCKVGPCAAVTTQQRAERSSTLDAVARPSNRQEVGAKLPNTSRQTRVATNAITAGGTCALILQRKLPVCYFYLPRAQRLSVSSDRRVCVCGKVMREISSRREGRKSTSCLDFLWGRRT